MPDKKDKDSNKVDWRAESICGTAWVLARNTHLVNPEDGLEHLDHLVLVLVPHGGAAVDPGDPVAAVHVPRVRVVAVQAAARARSVHPGRAGPRVVLKMDGAVTLNPSDS